MKIFGAVRPYPTSIRERVFSFLGSIGYMVGRNMILPAGTSNQEAARWIEKTSMHLLLLPFHLHRATDGTPLDGLSVAALLPKSFETQSIPILMPVTQFSWEGTFQGRMDLLLRARPEMGAIIVPMREEDIGASRITTRLEKIANSKSTTPNFAASKMVEAAPTSGAFEVSDADAPLSEQPESSVPFSYTRDKYKHFLDELEKKHAKK